MLSVAEVAQRAGVSTAAVRARLLEGTLAGRRVQKGGREVWEVFPDAAQDYVSRHTSSVAQGGELFDVAPGKVGSGQAGVDGKELRSQGTVDALLDENVRLRAALGALQRSHKELLEVVEGLLV